METPSPVRSEEEQQEPEINGCPFLGLPEDPGTRYTYAAAGNFCHRVSPPEPVDASYQGSVCLAAQEFRACPVYRREIRRNTLPQPIRGHLPQGIPTGRRFRVNWLWVVALLAVGAVVFLFLGPLRGGFAFGANASPAPSPSAKATTAPTLTPTATRAILALIPSLTPSPTLDETPVTTTASPGAMTPGPDFLTPFGFQNQFLLHPVAAGESLPFIANLYDTDTLVLRALNALDPGVSIQPGDILVVSPGKLDLIDITPLQPVFIEVDTDINELASRYVTTTNKIRTDNALGPSDIIPAGRWLVVPFVIVDNLFTPPTVTLTATPDLTHALAGPLGPDEAYYLHEVIAGESLPYIATLYQTTSEVLYALNDLPDDYAIRPGDILVVLPHLSDPASVDQAYSAHFVGAQISPADLAAQLGISEADLLAANPDLADPVPANIWVLFPIQ